jgi:sugar lactone lactonase YvrE
MRLDDERLKRALSGPVVPIDGASMERDLHVVVQRGRRHRRNRRLVGVIAALTAVVGAVVLAPRALDALRSVGEPRPARPPEPRGIITTVAGTGVEKSSGDGGPATEAAIRYPFDLAMDDAGNLYILQINRVRKVDPSGRITTVVGPPVPPTNLPLTEANLLRLRGTNALAIDAAGNLYVGGGEGKHFMVSRISPSGDVTRIAGTGRPGFSGEGGPALEAELGWVYDLVVDPVGNVYFTDYDNHCLWRVDTTGIIRIIAGTGTPGYSGDGGPATEARVGNPNGIALDSAGNIYVTQSVAGVVRRIDTNGVITTIAGTGRHGYSGDGGLATEARLTATEHVEVDDSGNVYIEDTGNQCIRVIDSEGIIRTVVGTCAESGFSGDGGPARSAQLWQPSGMMLTPDGVLYIADSANNRVRRVIL